MKQSIDSSAPHPRRRPARSSVCSRQESFPSPSTSGSGQAFSGLDTQDLHEPKCTTSPPSPIRENSNISGDVSGVEDWFDKSNSRLQITQDKFADGDSPYFLRQQGSSNDAYDSSPNGRLGHPHKDHAPRIVHTASNESSADGYRGVIDDLTLENRKLKERLRRYEASNSSPHLDKDKLFEVKMHALPSKKKRELEETLRAFAIAINVSANPLTTKAPSRMPCRHPPRDASHNPSSSSTSNSRPFDSAYASMSTSRPTSTSTLNRMRLEQKFGPQQNTAKDDSLQSFLHDIPEGLLPKYSAAMTEPQKRKAVVRRLEQLFTGKIGAAAGDHSQPHQQQEVSKSATRADRAADGLSTVEGHREANILPYEMDRDARRPEKQEAGLAHETQFSKVPSAEFMADNSLGTSSPDQRPTRPLDLDPDRAQIPSDNVDYIRHLGLSTPKFASEEPADAAADADGWIYLNLLVNMAQLHIINVTPDFVRSAVAEVSEKFQLSRDGQKVRWRGGTVGTLLSSNSGASSARNRSPNDSESLDDSSRKRRKIEVGRFASAPINITGPNVPIVNSQPNAFHYQPLFHRRSSSSEDSSFDESDSPHERGRRKGNGIRLRTSSSSSGGRRRGDGAIVFYSGAQFCTDLSGDRGHIDTPRHVTCVGEDGYSDHVQDALGCDPSTRPYPLDQTPSGSSIPFRPFKDCSPGPHFLQLEESQPKTPELLENNDMDMDFSPIWSSDRSNADQPLLDFSASGIGGTQPADHFTAKIETRRTILDGSTRARLSKFSAPSPACRRFIHRIPKSFLQTFHDSDGNNSPEDSTSRLVSLDTFSPSPRAWLEGFPVKIEILSAEFSRLEPSPLPAPSAYYAPSSSTEDDSDYSSGSSRVSHLYGDRSYLQVSSSSLTDPGLVPQATSNTRKEKQASERDEDDDIDDGGDETYSSIDMLAQERVLDHENVAARENEFERDIARKGSTSANSVNGDRGYSTNSQSSSGSDDDVEM